METYTERDMNMKMAVLMRLEGATFKYSADYYGIPISSLKDQYKASKFFDGDKFISDLDEPRGVRTIVPVSTRNYYYFLFIYLFFFF
jgi:hypothetical protein